MIGNAANDEQALPLFFVTVCGNQEVNQPVMSMLLREALQRAPGNPVRKDQVLSLEDALRLAPGKGKSLSGYRLDKAYAAVKKARLTNPNTIMGIGAMLDSSSSSDDDDESNRSHDLLDSDTDLASSDGGDNNDEQQHDGRCRAIKRGDWSGYVKVLKRTCADLFKMYTHSNGGFIQAGLYYVCLVSSSPVCIDKPLSAFGVHASWIDNFLRPYRKVCKFMWDPTLSMYVQSICHIMLSSSLKNGKIKNDFVELDYPKDDDEQQLLFHAALDELTMMNDMIHHFMRFRKKPIRWKDDVSQCVNSVHDARL